MTFPYIQPRGAERVGCGLYIYGPQGEDYVSAPSFILKFALRESLPCVQGSY
jgi:hypothetical protein